MANQKLAAVALTGQEKFTRLLSGAPQTKGMRSGLVQLSPGQEIGAHSTEDKEEALVILSGKAKIFYGERSSLLAKAPALVYIPSHTAHNVKNSGRVTLRYVYVVAPVIP